MPPYKLKKTKKIKISVHRETERGDVYTLLEPITIVWRDRVLEIPAGAQSDGASVPYIFQRLVFPGSHPKALRGAFAHDYIYRVQPSGWTRAEGDAMFRDILIDDGMSIRRSLFAWGGVRIGGWSAWNKYARENKKTGGIGD
jgi:hypothetical protein